MVKILGVAGSVRPDSQSRKILALAVREFEGLGVEVERVDFREFALPFCDGSEVYEGYPDVERWRDAVVASDGLLVVTPEYHGCVSGVLKNALDLLEIRHMEGKVVAIASVLGGAASNNALNSLRTICRHVHAWVIPEQVVMAHSGEILDKDGELMEEELRGRLSSLVKSLVNNTQRLKV